MMPCDASLKAQAVMRLAEIRRLCEGLPQLWVDGDPRGVSLLPAYHPLFEPAWPSAERLSVMTYSQVIELNASLLVSLAHFSIANFMVFEYHEEKRRQDKSGLSKAVRALLCS